MFNKNVIDCNPFFVYIICFSIPIMLYQLDWSYLYPPLSFGLLLFFAVTFLISLFMGIYINSRGVLRYIGNIRRPNLKMVLIGLTLGNAIDFAYEKRIPLISVLNLVTQDNYGSFGVPTFAVLISTLGSFMTAYLFNCYLVTKEKKYMFSSLYLFIFPILIFSRGILLLNLSNVLFVYLFSIQKGKSKIYLKIGLFLLGVLLLFGYAGNLRTNNQGSKDDSSSVRELMYTLGDAKPGLVKSSIPPEFFWSYIYISSPLANLQQNINTYDVEYTANSVFRYFNYELVFDSVSKRIGDILGIEKLYNNLIAPYLTVGSIYSGSYTNLGWFGMGLTFLFLIIIITVYVILLKPSNPYYATGLAVLNTLVLFNLFDNMISFTALSFQLLYPFLFSIKFKEKIKPIQQNLVK